MNEIKWMRFRVVDKNYLDGVCCVEHTDGRSPGLRFWTSPGELHDAPDDEQLRRDVTDWQHSGMRMRGEADALRDRVSELERLKAEAYREAEGFRESLDAEIEALRVSTEHVAKLRAENERLRRDHSDVTATVCRLEEDNAKLRTELSKWKQAGKAEQAERVRLESENERLKRDLENARASLVTTSDQLGLAQDQRDALLQAGSGLRGLLAQYSPTNREIRKWDEAYDVHIRGIEPDQPAPQTHYRENDLVLAPVTGRLYRLMSFLGHLSIGAEEWLSMHGRVAIKPAENPILERDGTPTDEGLRRLAEKAGLAFFPSAYLYHMGFTINREKVWLDKAADARDRRALAAALREMGGA